MSEIKQAIIMRTDLGMGKGKIATQASHASVSAFIKAQIKDKKIVDEWLSSQKKVVLKIDNLEELLELFERARKLLPVALIKDAGRTQISPGTITALGIGPAKEEAIDQFTKHLKLL